MSEVDEYDAYNNSLDVDNELYAVLDGINSTPLRLVAPPDSFSRAQDVDASAAQVFWSPISSHKSAHSDDFSAYNFSELTEEDFALIDASTRAVSVPSASVATSSRAPTSTGKHTHANKSGPARSNTSSGNFFGGPAIDIEIEQYTNISTVFKAARSEDLSWKSTTQKNGAEGLAGYNPPLPPFDQFRSWGRTLAVTDLSAPSWCEVQFDYGLRQGRSRKLEDRPSKFVTAEGTLITVNNAVAVVNDRIATRGKTVHRALEREVHPEELIVEVETPQDRWGLKLVARCFSDNRWLKEILDYRLVQMINSIYSIIDQDLCREMPVFGILHNELIVGIIDSIERQTLLPSPVTEMPDFTTQSGSGENKRRRDPLSVPSTPSKLRSKKACASPLPAQPQITSFFPISPTKTEVNGKGKERANDSSDSGRPTTPPIPSSVHPEQSRFQLHISDTKTRRYPSMPLEEDTLPARIQLMLYRRLLSNLLASPPSPEAVDFEAVWDKLELSPTAAFSSAFVEQAELNNYGPPEGEWCLRDLVRVFKSSVEALHVAGVDSALTVEYRSQSRRRRKREPDEDAETDKGKEKVADEDVDMIPAPHPVEEAEVEKARLANLASSPAASQVREDHAEVPPRTHVASFQEQSTAPSETRSETAFISPEGSSVSPNIDAGAHGEADNGQLQQTIHQPLSNADPALKDEGAASAKADRPSTGVIEDADSDDSSADTDEPARKKWSIIGTKTIYYDADFLENYLTSVLEYWHGERARGALMSL
ncbi:hypothetical protein NM688_g8096 [Phlebia brevispora]|uniref:Uncharacterized protein n=1 Tax=Phlebia brevispora TaxID=194682 RepID=A0ACC1RXD7_9APHY|nr:hypothetical protein NM688_g8096 [Phlebia brevispora]